VNKRVLLVDDEPDILRSFQRQLRKDFEIFTASSGAEGLESAKSEQPFAAVVSDFQMPQMDGIQFLSQFKAKSPDTTRVMLTGQADLNVAMEAVNQGNLFRFLTKPCSKEAMVQALNAACDQHRLITGEKEILEKTLGGSIKVMTDMLGLVNPSAFGRSLRIKNYVNHMVSLLNLPNAWQFEVAALLSLIGYITIPQDIITKIYSGSDLSEVEQEVISKHPAVACDLLEHIPRLENIARMIEAQNGVFERRSDKDDFKGENLIALGGNLLRIAVTFDNQITRGLKNSQAIQKLRQQPEIFFPEAVAALESFRTVEVEEIHLNITARELNVQMVLNEDIIASTGLTIAIKGQEVTQVMLQRLRSFAKSVGINEPFKVIEKQSM
jgi:response regulator RpfG family c-di-GMP phosphodiesterase